MTKPLFFSATSERGATMVEYGLILALISIAVITTVTAIGFQIDIRFHEICSILNHGQACNIDANI